MGPEGHTTDTRSHSSVPHRELDVTDMIQQDAMRKESPHPSMRYYQLEFVLIRGRGQFGDGNAIEGGERLVGFALGAHGGKRTNVGGRSGTISYLFPGGDR